MRDGGVPLKPKLWEKEKAKMQKDVTLCEWKMKAFKDELSRAENIKKVLEQLALQQPTIAPKKELDR